MWYFPYLDNTLRSNVLVHLWKKLIFSSVALTFFSSILKSKHLDLFLQVNIFCLKLTYCKQFCLLLKPFVSFFKIWFHCVICWTSSLVSSFCPFVVGIHFFVRKLGSYCAWYIASLASWSMLLDNRPLLICQLVHFIYSE